MDCESVINEKKKVYWVIAAGDGKRNYSNVFFRHGIMLIGPGDQGSYFENQNQTSEVKWFAENVKPGHIIILKHTNRILAAGIAESARGWLPNETENGYFHSEMFSNVEGFVLQHGRYVTWYLNEKPGEQRGLPYHSRPLFHTHKDIVKEKAEKIIALGKREKIKCLPSHANSVEDDALIGSLVKSGLGRKDAKVFVRTLTKIRRLGQWYDDHWQERNNAGEELSEHETRTFLITPLLLALGWPEQRLKIEWNNIDIAFFQTQYKPGCIPEIILETKKLYEPLQWAKNQAERYARNYPSCKKLIVSNGIRYSLFLKKENTWVHKAHFNLLKLCDRHPYYEKIAGAPDFLRELLP